MAGRFDTSEKGRKLNEIDELEIDFHKVPDARAGKM